MTTKEYDDYVFAVITAFTTLKSTWLTQKSKKKDNNNSNTFLWKKVYLIIQIQKRQNKRNRSARKI